MMTNKIVFIDTEVSIKEKKVCDIGAIKDENTVLHSASVDKFYHFIGDAKFICGHNIIHHDLKYLPFAEEKKLKAKAIDTLYLSPLLFPKRPYHSLLKDDKLQTDELNNPVNDCKKAQHLFYDEVNAFLLLSWKMKQILGSLLYKLEEFSAFFEYMKFKPYFSNSIGLIRREFEGKICANIDLKPFILDSPRELAYALSLICVQDDYSITPSWLLFQFPKIEVIMKTLRNTPCINGCNYCNRMLNIHMGLKSIFGYDKFREYNGEPLQEKAVKAAIEGKSLLAVFPTGGGKSITFQLPALMAGKAIHGLTVVISPLQSLMKDQVDALNSINIKASYINSSLSDNKIKEISRHILNNEYKIIYVAPERLDSYEFINIIKNINVSQIAVDEAHCISQWGHDFRKSYTKIADFIGELKKRPIVTAFTATASTKVKEDIIKNLKLQEYDNYTTGFNRDNLEIDIIKNCNKKEYILNAYEIAKENNYRFFSFGDAMFIK